MVDVVAGALVSADAALLRAVLSVPYLGWLDGVFLAASIAGTGGGLWMTLAVVLWAARRVQVRDVVAVIATVALLHIMVDVVLKPAFARPRPSPSHIAGIHDGGPGTPSFPSGHAANASAAAFILTRRWRSGGALIWPSAVLVAVARVFLGWHYPGDAVGGLLIGLACAGGISFLMFWTGARGQ